MLSFPLSKHKPIVFAGPSIALWDKEDRKLFKIYPPIKRGGLDFLTKKPPGVCIIIDGVFGREMSITPTECRDLLKRGWFLMGCSSMGALRAADLWNLGMVGIGDIYMMYRLGKCLSDADVAVVYDTDSYAEKTISLVHVQYLVSQLIEEQKIDLVEARKLIKASQEIKWFERHPVLLQKKWNNLTGRNILDVKELQDTKKHPKCMDALKLLRCVKSLYWA